MIDLASGEQLCALDDSAKPFSTVTLSRDGHILATGEYAQIRLWDADTCQPQAAWTTGDDGFSSFPWTKGITNLSFSSDNKVLFSANWWTGKVTEWDWTSQQMVSSFGLTNTICYKFTPDAKQILVDFDQYGFELRNPQTGALEVTHDKIVGAAGFIDFSGDGQRVVVWGYNTDQGGTAGVWDLASNTLLQQFSVGRNQTDWTLAALNTDGSNVALMNEARQAIVFFEVASGKELQRLNMP